MSKNTSNPQIAVILGSDSDLATIDGCVKTLDELGLTCELRILSAHRTPRQLTRYVESLQTRGVKVVIAAAGLSAALPGVVAAHTLLPVIGIPVNAGSLGGLDALLSISQMPPGVPVAAMTIGSAGAKNAALLAARIIALGEPSLQKRLKDYADAQSNHVLQKDRRLRDQSAKGK